VPVRNCFAVSFVSEGLPACLCNRVMGKMTDRLACSRVAMPPMKERRPLEDRR